MGNGLLLPAIEEHEGIDAALVALGSDAPRFCWARQRRVNRRERKEMRLYLVNPDNPVVSLNKVNWSRLNAYRVWKPLGLLVVAGLTPPDWEVTLIDENLGHPDYGRLPKPDLVGVTAFTSQAPRAYEVAAVYRAMGVPVQLTRRFFSSRKDFHIATGASCR